MHQNIHEGRASEQMERGADALMKNKAYRPYFEALESGSPLSKVRSITPYDVYAVGQQLKAFEEYRDMCEDDGTLTQLGKIPDVALMIH